MLTCTSTMMSGSSTRDSYVVKRPLMTITYCRKYDFYLDTALERSRSSKEGFVSNQMQNADDGEYHMRSVRYLTNFHQRQALSISSYIDKPNQRLMSHFLITIILHTQTTHDTLSPDQKNEWIFSHLSPFSPASLNYGRYHTVSIIVACPLVQSSTTFSSTIKIRSTSLACWLLIARISRASINLLY